MPLASSNLYGLRYAVEPSFGGTTPTTGLALRNTGESLTYSLQTTTSQEIRSDRQVTDLVQTSASASGGYNFELSFNEHDALLEGALQSTWLVYGTLGVGATFSATTMSATAINGTGLPITNLAVGQWFKLVAPTTANDGKWFRISETVAPTSTVITVSAATPLAVVGTSTASCTISTSRLSNGVTQKYFSLERAHTDIAQFFLFKGMTANKLSFNFATGSIATGTLDFMGKIATRTATTAFSTAVTASTAYDVMNAVSGVGYVLENNTALTGTYVKSISLDIDNAMRGQNGIGSLGNVGVGAGTLTVSGTMEVYLADGVLYDKFLNNTATSLTWNIKDGNGNGYAFTLPKVKFGDAKVNAGGLNQDLMLSIPFTALMDAATQKTIFIDRAGVATTR
jgi:hypothetical protein